ncbi:FYVE, RhoGEF and PH domain-containing protein 6 [Apodemus speciosus]|uniref:FYVE, RhoGEF and PH domain-containing protein 6 n=1 Tax=Apodemus speciosus TaxID=105296 RepID=A0ABQ0F8D8_APOSI
MQESAGQCGLETEPRVPPSAGGSAAERDDWLEAISSSIEEYAKKRITFCPSRSLDEDSEGKEDVSPLGAKAPIWIPDTRATMCMICTSEFTLTWRRHHCRACGKIVCQACSSHKCGLDYLKGQPARVCEHCFQELQKLVEVQGTKPKALAVRGKWYPAEPHSRSPDASVCKVMWSGDSLAGTWLSSHKLLLEQLALFCNFIPPSIYEERRAFLEKRFRGIQHSEAGADHQLSPRIGSPGNHKSPSSALSSVLHSIPSGRKQKKIPAALKEVSANTEDSSMSGYLYRSKGSKKPWKHLWFVIKNKVLYTYAASEDVAALESQPLLGFTVTQVKDENSESKMFQLLHKGMVFYIFKADDAHSTQRWIDAFQEGTVL